MPNESRRAPEDGGAGHGVDGVLTAVGVELAYQGSVLLGSDASAIGEKGQKLPSVAFESASNAWTAFSRASTTGATIATASLPATNIAGGVSMPASCTRTWPSFSGSPG